MPVLLTILHAPVAFGRAVRRRVLGIDPNETLIERRGFAVTSAAARTRLESIGSTFVTGYHSALGDAEPRRLTERLCELPRESWGWAFEGAAMALALRDSFRPWRSRGHLQRFLAGGAAPHTYLVHVGAGWVAARLHRDPVRMGRHLDPLLRWLLVDGYGFHQGYFHWRKSIGEQRLPRFRSAAWKRHSLDPAGSADAAAGGALHVYHQGLGRSLWFVEGTEVEQIQTRIAHFPECFHADLWSGIGLAAAYAGNGASVDWPALLRASDAQASALAQGVCFATKARMSADNATAHTEAAARAVWRRSAAECAEVSDAARRRVEASPEGAASGGYAAWRQEIQQRWTDAEVSR